MSRTGIVKEQQQPNEIPVVKGRNDGSCISNFACHRHQCRWFTRFGIEDEYDCVAQGCTRLVTIDLISRLIEQHQRSSRLGYTLRV